MEAGDRTPCPADLRRDDLTSSSKSPAPGTEQHRVSPQTRVTSRCAPGLSARGLGSEGLRARDPRGRGPGRPTGSVDLPRVLDNGCSNRANAKVP